MFETKNTLVILVIMFILSSYSVYRLYTTARKTESNIDTGRWATRREVLRFYGTATPFVRRVSFSALFSLIIVMLGYFYGRASITNLTLGCSVLGVFIYASVSLYSQRHERLRRFWGDRKNFYHLGRFRGRRVSLPREQRFMHTLIVGPTGIGKTSALIIPQILYDAYGCISAIVIDAKSPELYTKVAGAWIENGKRVIIFDPWHPDCWGFNPLPEATDDEIQTIVNAFLGDQRRMQKRDEFFEGRTHDFLESLLKLIREEFKGSQCSLSIAYQLIKSHKVLNQFIQCCRNPEIITGFDDWMKRTNESQMDILSSVRKKLSIFKEPQVQSAFSRSDFTLEILFREEEPALLIIGVPVDKKEVGMQIASLMTRLVMRRAFEEKRIQRQRASKGEIFFRSNDLALYLDEFENLNIVDMPEYISIARDTNTQCVLSTTNIDFFENYGDRFGAIMTNLRTQIYLSGINLKTSKYVSEMLGKQRTLTTRYFTEPIIPWLDKKQIAWEPDVLMSDDSIRNMDKKKAICFTPDTRPFILNLERYYESRLIKGLIKPLPQNINEYKKKWGIDTSPLRIPVLPQKEYLKTYSDTKRIKESRVNDTGVYKHIEKDINERDISKKPTFDPYNLSTDEDDGMSGLIL